MDPETISGRNVCYANLYFDNSRNIVDLRAVLRYTNTMSMKETTAAECFAALGHPTRLGIYRALVRAGDDGAPVGVLQEALGVPGSTLTHHIKALAAAGLVKQERDGRILTTRADFGQMRDLTNFLTDDCCKGLGVFDKDDAA